MKESTKKSKLTVNSEERGLVQPVVTSLNLHTEIKAEAFMKLTPLVVVPLIFLAGCVGQGAQHENTSQEELGMIFSIPDASFTLTAECTLHAEVEHDEAERPMVVVSMHRSPECSEKAFDTVFSKTGQQLTVEYKNQVLVESSLIVTPMDPASPNWIGVESDALAHEISEMLN